MDQPRQDQLTDLTLKLENETRTHLSTAAKWGKFIAILVFCFIGIMLLAVLAAAEYLEEAFGKMLPGFGSDGGVVAGVFIGLFVLLLVVLGVIHYFLLKFSTGMKAALNQENETKLASSFNALKLYFIISTVVSAFFLLFSVMGIFK